MTLTDAIILGIIQGITEFLPISSSGHLVLGQTLLGVNTPGNVFEVVTHLGTLLSVLYVFWKELSSMIHSLQKQDTQKYILFLIVGTLPAVIIGLAAKDMITDLFESISMVAGSLIFTGIILLLTQRLNEKSKQLNWKKGLMIGLTQAFAMIPGISRSGMTISTGLALGLSGKDAAKFSFLLAIPAIAGAGLLTALDVEPGSISIPFFQLSLAFFSAFIVGTISLKWLLGLLESGKFHLFGYYCLMVGLITYLSI
ncbi:MAG: undecaprenyl-diphosphatase UppP [Candidatus Marinimicrobia bacterium]|nr:undecaprenyl-diphosphatase UppP [Candidatus Neomarinimicrobiota bacterium]MBL7030365.1 undecaprenyl-diphosphatase UppP [Candidatus Neomarinimicrobiota bacterium]